MPTMGNAQRPDPEFLVNFDAVITTYAHFRVLEAVSITPMAIKVHCYFPHPPV